MAFGDPDAPTELAQIVVATTSVASKTVNPHRGYTLMHLGDDGAGTPSQESVYFAFDVASATASMAAATNKAALICADGGSAGNIGGVLHLPPGIQPGLDQEVAIVVPRRVREDGDPHFLLHLIRRQAVIGRDRARVRRHPGDKPLKSILFAVHCVPLCFNMCDFVTSLDK